MATIYLDKGGFSKDESMKVKALVESLASYRKATFTMKRIWVVETDDANLIDILNTLNEPTQAEMERKLSGRIANGLKVYPQTPAPPPLPTESALTEDEPDDPATFRRNYSAGWCELCQATKSNIRNHMRDMHDVILSKEDAERLRSLLRINDPEYYRIRIGEAIEVNVVETPDIVTES